MEPSQETASLAGRTLRLPRGLTLDRPELARFRAPCSARVDVRCEVDVAGWDASASGSGSLPGRPQTPSGIALVGDADGFRAFSAVMHVVGRVAKDGTLDVSLAFAPGLSDRAFATLSLLGAALGELDGGLVIHAAVADLGGHAIAFVGPSGAGKSTALRQLSGATEFAADRALVRVRDRVVFPLPGGEPSGCPTSVATSLPLVGLYAVRHDGRRSGVSMRSAAADVASLRGAITTALHDEHDVLDRASQLILALRSDQRAGELWTKLDEPVTLSILP